MIHKQKKYENLTIIVWAFALHQLLGILEGAS